MSGRPRNPTDKLLTRLTRTPQGRQMIREAVRNMTGGLFSDLRRAPTAVHLPGCPNGCGEMLALDDGWQCPVCNRYRGYYRGERHP